MKKFVKLAIVSALFTLGAFQTYAGSTNEVHALSVAFTVLTQGTTSTNGTVITETVDHTRIMNKDLINLLSDSGTVFSNNTGTVTTSNFSSKAELILKIKKHVSSATPVFYVRDLVGTNKVDFNVSGNIGVTVSDIKVESARLNTANGNSSGTETEIITFNFSAGDTVFSANGVITLRHATITDRFAGFIDITQTVVGSVSGTGTSSGDDAIVFGSFAAGSAKIEIN